MASFTAIKSPLQVRQAANNDTNCSAQIFSFNGGNVSKTRVLSKRLTRIHPALRNKSHVQKSINVLQYPGQKSWKRRYTFAGHECKVSTKRRRRISSVALPTKFLLGGNINDPLNLKSLEDEEVNKRLNAFTPKTSPMPMSSHRTQVKVLIPPNIYDPLNLNTGEEIEFNLITRRSRKRKRHRKGKKEEMEKYFPNEEEQYVTLSAISEENLDPVPEEKCVKETKPIQLNIFHSETRPVVDKIVSPVVPQGSPSKFYKRFHSKGIKESSNNSEGPALKNTVKKQNKSSSVQSRQSSTNAKLRKCERFQFGNFYSCGSSAFEMKWLNPEFFTRKDVLDIGCNTGSVTLYIAEHFEPKRIVGIDIDEKLVNIAKRNLCNCISNILTASEKPGSVKFPASMAFLYGPLVKVPVLLPGIKISEFPNNVQFQQMDYLSNCTSQGQATEYDTILCLRVTMWIHLNWGDAGLKKFFRNIFHQLKHGGHFIFEPQPWSCYASKKKQNPIFLANYNNIKLKPNHFCEYLISEEIGFSTFEVIGRSVHPTKGYRHCVYLLTKQLHSPDELNSARTVPSLQFAAGEWLHHYECNDFDSWKDSDSSHVDHPPSFNMFVDDEPNRERFAFHSQSPASLNSSPYCFFS